MIALIFLVLSIVLSFKSVLISVIFGVIALIISAINLKNKSVINIIVFVISLIITIFNISSIFIYGKMVKDTTEKFTKCSEDNIIIIEKKAQNYAQEYFITKQLLHGVNDFEIIKLEDLNSYGCECVGYATYNNDKAKAYIKCDDYQTIGYDSNMQSKVN